MKTLAERQADRVARKAEHAVTERAPFNPSRGGIGKIDRRYIGRAEANEIDAATNAAIADRVAELGAPSPVQPTPEIPASPIYGPKVKFGGY